MENVGVVAGNLSECRGYFFHIAAALGGTAILKANELIVGDTRFFYVRDAVIMRGLDGVELRYVGTYYNRKDLREIQEEATMRNMGKPARERGEETK